MCVVRRKVKVITVSEQKFDIALAKLILNSSSNILIVFLAKDV